MARYDDLTREFMSKVSGVALTPPDTPGEKIEDNARRFLSAGKTLLKTKNPLKTVAQLAAPVVADKILEKTGSKSITELYSMLNDRYGKSWWDWEPETLWETFKTEFHFEPDGEDKNLVLALQVLLNTDQAHEQWHVFENVGHAFNNNPVSFAVVQPLELQEAALTLAVMNYLRPQEELDSEICAYIASSAKNSGVVYLPEEFFPKECQEILDDLNNDLALRDEVKATWPRVYQNESPLGIQLMGLQEIKDYVEEHFGAERGSAS